ncbi:hypothetical protein [Peribacillus frigoritolerans]|uniref:hypothetical protein n=1 Tax=Peribacillus frigoritolerans TaxID=450367 RepID=UPI00227F29AC|nr:hypothetical protein [Peribacillus frigoritolerans]MCY8935647.1 hypothetical protein [Peribacillus frigoritolerans]
MVADIIQVDHALESMRNPGFYLPGASGEPIDNSIEVRATLIRVLPRPQKKKVEKIELRKILFWRHTHAK